MTATAMPLAWVWVMILLTSASMAAPLGIVCAVAATGRQKAVKSTANSGRTFFRVLMVAVLSELDPDWWCCQESIPSSWFELRTGPGKVQRFFIRVVALCGPDFRTLAAMWKQFAYVSDGSEAVLQLTESA